MIEFLSSDRFLILGVPALFFFFAVLFKAVTRAGGQFQEHLLDVTQVGIELCLLNLAYYAAVLFLVVRTPLLPERDALVGALVILLGAGAGLTLVCAFLKACIYPRSQLAETVLADLFGGTVLVFGMIFLLRVVNEYHLLPSP